MHRAVWRLLLIWFACRAAYSCVALGTNRNRDGWLNMWFMRRGQANIHNTPRLNRSIVAFLFVILSRRVRHAPFTLQMFGKNRQSRCGHKFSAAIVEQMPARHKKSPNERSKRPITTRRACRTTKCSHCLKHPSNDRTYPKHTRCDGHTNMSCYSSDIWQLPYGWTKKTIFLCIFSNIHQYLFRSIFNEIVH